MWNRQQTQLFEEAAGRELVLAADGRSDSPGHCAKYGSYTVIDVQKNNVLHVETVQVQCTLMHVLKLLVCHNIRTHFLKGIKFNGCDNTFQDVFYLVSSALPASVLGA